ncbi:hypothetical protein [Sinorhizobium medicae]|uniref:Uncharacterized protein n=1 Tax=Sinorhizobium medicae TaxID=110321 RepID=A0ABX4TLX3_9HYPH|nr:hypothetical protein [Sinorhizobium medicae]PLU03827.1 hypothetical protein BMJ33_13065 [Sinorhizobium medicae]PLU17457.1 hypothetical protein BMJ29_21090 [Sinorhizobium medicae]PLU77021.1 hypothetical protein BMJ19_26350 [Sinorhizobium medicae]
MPIESDVAWYLDVWNWLAVPTNAVAFAQVLAAIVTAFATIALWHVTRILAVETKVLSSMTSRPFVVFSFQSSLAAAEALDSMVSNTGNATAFDVEVTISPALPNGNGSRDPEKEESKFLVSLLPPGAAIPKQGVMSRDVYEETFSVDASWSSSPNSAKRERIRYNIQPQDGFRAGWRVKGDHQIAEELEKIRKLLPK